MDIDLPAPKRGFTTHFHCTACGHDFRREIRRIYVHMPALKQQAQQNKPNPRSPYIIPQRIACPKCGQVDQYTLAPQTLSSLMLSTLASAIGGGLHPQHPVQVITFALHDGTPIHPLDALEYYRQKTAAAPQDLGLRMRYANVFRSLGYLDEAEAQYQHILAADPTRLEAWLGAASIHIARKHPGAARKALQQILAYAPRSRQPDRDGYQAQAQAYLDGLYPLEDLTPDRLLFGSKLEPAPPPAKKSRRRHKRKSA